MLLKWREFNKWMRILLKEWITKEVIPRSEIGRWKCVIDSVHYCFYNTHYSFFTTPWDTLVSLVGWVYVIHIVMDVMESENSKNSHRINMESFPLSDETWQDYGPIGRWIEWYRCIFALIEVCENLAGGGVDEKGVSWRIENEQAKWVISWLAKMYRLFVERNEGSWVTRTW